MPGKGERSGGEGRKKERRGREGREEK